MNTNVKPKVYISYTWLNGMNSDGEPIRVPDERAFKLAERLREAGFDPRLDMYFKDNHYGFAPPQHRRGDSRDPWIIWAEEQIRDADCVLLLCTPEYVASDPNLGECPGAWCDWHLMDDNLKFNEKGLPEMFHERKPALWWDWHCIAKDLDAKPEKFIPVGFGPYRSQNIPAFVRATYYNLESTSDFEGLRRRIRSEYQRLHPRQGVFISYAHKDDQRWLESLLDHLALLKRRGVEIWTDREIRPGANWHEEIQNSLARAKVAVLLVTPAFLQSPYIASDELPIMLRAANSEGLVIFPIPVKPSSYEQSELAPFQAAHPLSEPLSGLRAAKRDQAFVNIASKLADALGVNKAKEP
jgi:TIR domain-containing protein